MDSMAVSVYFIKNQEKILVGRLHLKDRKIFFEYSAEWISTGFELSPFKLPLQSGLKVSQDLVFDGLFGVFNDSLPDGWGRLLLDRKLTNRGLNPGSLSPLDRLCYVGSHGMGALIYEPETSDDPSIADKEDLDQVEREIVQFQENDSDFFIDHLIGLSGSSAGARPKIVVKVNGEDWMIKFRSSFDPKDISLIEYAYHLMAQEAGLDVPKAQLFPSKKMPGYFGVRRFDRTSHHRLHMHTVSGLLHADHRIPNLDYEMIMRATLLLTKNGAECEKQFRSAVFNVLSHNRDDHAKNFSFLMSEEGVWRISPVYDLTFSSGPSGEHSSTVMGEGRMPTPVHLIQLASICGMKEQKALQVMHEVKAAVSKWDHVAQSVGVGSTSRKMIQNSLNSIAQSFLS